MGERTYKKKASTMELTTDNGWFLTLEGLELCNNSFEEAINMDLSEIGAPSLPEGLGRGKEDVIKAGKKEAYICTLSKSRADILTRLIGSNHFYSNRLIHIFFRNHSSSQ